MLGACRSIQNSLSRNHATTLFAALVTLVAVVAALLVAELTFPLLADVAANQARVVTAATATLVAAPVSWIVVRAAVTFKEDKRRLAIRENLLSTAHQYAKQGYWDFDVSTGRFTLSAALHQLLGGPETTLELTTPALMSMANPEDRETLAMALQRMVVDGSPEQIEHRITGFDGQERTFWATGTRLLGRDGTPVKAFGISQDITGFRSVEAALRESEEHYRHAVELSPLISWVEDAHGNTLELSPRWYDLTGNPVEHSLGTGWTESLHPDDLAATNQLWHEALRTGQTYDVEHRVLVASGTYRWFRSRASARRDDRGEIVRWYGTVEDIHARKLADNALRQSEAFATSILESTPDCVEVVDLSGHLQFINKSGYKLMESYGFEPRSGQNWLELWSPHTLPKVYEALETARTGAVARFACTGPTVDGAPAFCDVTLQPILDAAGQPERLLCISRDITALKVVQNELERAREAAEHAARHDSLTGVPNRAYFREQLTKRLQDTKAESQTAVLFLDLDEFKSVNDTLGHPAGDKLLCEVADRLRANLRRPDQIARFGGDEFAILQAKIDHPDQVESLARRITACLGEPFWLEDQQVVVGTSIGIAVTDGCTPEPDELLKRADIALYAAKSGGGGLYRFFEPDMEAAAEHDQRLRAELREALSRGEFCVHYQPILDLGTYEVMSFEALLRWQHPQRGLVSPAEFIALAETTGAIVEMGEWVLQQACSMASSWPQDIAVSVNLSPRQFRTQCLVRAVTEALSTSGLRPERLQLEITESLLLQDDDKVRQTIERLRALGVRISIDDFGTGYSSLGYLRRFSVDNIKIDKSFVADLSSNPRTAAILQAVMALAEGLEISLTAEGIEEPWQLEQLRAMGCSQGQGYLFSRPVPAEAVDPFISKSRASDLGPASSTTVTDATSPRAA